MCSFSSYSFNFIVFLVQGQIHTSWRFTVHIEELPVTRISQVSWVVLSGDVRWDCEFGVWRHSPYLSVSLPLSLSLDSTLDTFWTCQETPCLLLWWELASSRWRSTHWDLGKMTSHLVECHESCATRCQCMLCDACFVVLLCSPDLFYSFVVLISMAQANLRACQGDADWDWARWWSWVWSWIICWGRVCSFTCREGRVRVCRLTSLWLFLFNAHFWRLVGRGRVVNCKVCCVPVV